MARITLPFVPEGMSVVPDEDLDLRTDEDVLAQLRAYIPPDSSHRNVWAYWDKGFDQMPGWQRRNVMDWARLLHKSKTGSPWVIRILDKVPGSEHHFSRYIDQELLPEVLHKDQMTGPYVGQHSANLVRLAALYQHGGFWLDLGTILIRHLDDLWSLIDGPNTPFELFSTSFPLIPDRLILINTFLAAKARNEFIRRWHTVYLEFWKNGTTECTGFHAHPLLQHLPLFQPPASPALGKTAAGLSDYATHMRCAQRVYDMVDADDGFDGRQYYETKVCLFPAADEVVLFSMAHDWDGAREAAVLATRYDRPDDPEYPHAREIVCKVLQNSAFLKLSNGLATAVPWLSAVWNDPKHVGADSAAGTFAEYLRQGTLQFKQTRTLTPQTVGKIQAKVWTMGLLEPCGKGE